jgi:hypothetical protein
MDRIVNVLFHGVFGYVLREKCIEIYTPAVCHHVYMAGGIDNASCKPLVRGLTYDLRGVCGDPNQRSKPNNDDYPLLSLDAGDTLDEFNKRFCKFHIPYPRTIDGYSSQMYPVDAFEAGAIFAGANAGPLNGMDVLPSSLIFVYLRNDGMLRLESETGDSVIDLSQLPETCVPGITNVHIWCTLQNDPNGMSPANGMSPEGHLRRAFAALVDCFPELELTIEIPDRFAPTAVDAEDLPPGVGPCDVDPDRKSCAKKMELALLFGKTNCHYSSVMFWPE